MRWRPPAHLVSNPRQARMRTTRAEQAIAEQVWAEFAR
jgi:hypothetical protein